MHILLSPFYYLQCILPPVYRKGYMPGQDGPVGDIADEGVLDGVVMLSAWVVKGLLCLLPK